MVPILHNPSRRQHFNLGVWAVVVFCCCLLGSSRPQPAAMETKHKLAQAHGFHYRAQKRKHLERGEEGLSPARCLQGIPTPEAPAFPSLPHNKQQIDIVFHSSCTSLCSHCPASSRNSCSKSQPIHQQQAACRCLTPPITPEAISPRGTWKG